MERQLENNNETFISRLKREVSAMFRRAFDLIYLVSTVFFSQLGNCLIATFSLDYCNTVYMELYLKTIPKLYLDQNMVVKVVMNAPQFTYVTLLFCELHQLPLCFQVQFKMLMVIYCIKLFIALGPRYLLLSPTISPHPIRPGRVNCLLKHAKEAQVKLESSGWVLLALQYWSMGMFHPKAENKYA